MDRLVEVRLPYFSGGWRSFAVIGNEEWVRDVFVDPGVFYYDNDDANAYVVGEIRDVDDRIIVTMIGPADQPDEAVRDCG